MFIEQLITGSIGVLSSASINVLVAIGLALTFRLMNIINLAHGEFLMIGAYSVVFSAGLGLPFAASVLIAVVISFALGLIVEATVIKRCYRSVELSILATWGVSIVLQQIIELLFGKSFQNVNNPVPGSVAFLGIEVPIYRLLIIIAAILVSIIVLVSLNKTLLGTRIRAITQDSDLAESVGVRSGLIKSLVFAGTCSLAAVTGVLVAPLSTVNSSMGTDFIFIAFVVVIIAGKRIEMLILAAVGAALIQNILTIAVDPVMGKLGILALAVVTLVVAKRSKRMELV